MSINSTLAEQITAAVMANLETEITKMVSQALVAQVDESKPATTKRTKSTSKKAPKKAAEPKADLTFRTAKQKEAGHQKAKEIWAKHYRAAGVRRYADLTPKQQKAASKEVKEMWDAIKGTRKTKHVAAI